MNFNEIGKLVKLVIYMLRVSSDVEEVISRARNGSKSNQSLIDLI